jgi:hypothetical protein
MEISFISIHFATSFFATFPRSPESFFHGAVACENANSITGRGKKSCFYVNNTKKFLFCVFVNRYTLEMGFLSEEIYLFPCDFFEEN